MRLNYFISLCAWFLLLSEASGQESFFHSQEQLDSLRYDFLNQKITADSTQNMALMEYSISVDTNCSVYTYLSEDNQDTSLIKRCWDVSPLLETNALGYYIDSSEVFSFVKYHYKNGLIDSMHYAMNPRYRFQINHPIDEWDKDRLTAQKRYPRKKRWWRKYKREMVYGLSNPIFFEVNDRAIIYVLEYWDPHIANLSVQYYRKDENGKWTYVAGDMIWMS
jgi:hypothetical protein